MAKKNTQSHFMQLLTRTLPFSIMFCISLLLLFYIGKGEARHSYASFQFEKASAIGEIVQTKVNAYLNSGLPLSQYVGFQPLSIPLISADSYLDAMSVQDKKQKFLFTASTKGFYAPQLAHKSHIKTNGKPYDAISETDKLYRLSLNLKNKFQTVGRLNIDIRKDRIEQKVNDTFSAMPLFFILAVLLFSGATMLVFHKKLKRSTLFIKLAYGTCFVFMIGIIVFNLIGLYSSGIQDKAKSITKTISQRLNTALELGLKLDDFTGIDTILNNYKKINPDISFIALSQKGKALIHTTKKATGKKLERSALHFEYNEPIGKTKSKQDALHVWVSIPRNIIYKKMWRSIKNFILLFLASTFLAFFFLNFIFSLQEKKILENQKAPTRRHNAFRLDMVRPLYFLTIFIEGLLISFIPQYFKNISEVAGFGAGSASILFTAYFLAFVASLIPSGRYADRHGFKRLIQFGVIAYTLSYFSLALSSDFFIVFAGRLLAGVGQGMLFIGVQSYILEAAHKDEKTQGTSIIVSGYNSGMISGTAIGALLAVQIGPGNIFVLAGATSILVFLYILFLLPEVQPAKVHKKINTLRENLKLIYKDKNFVKTILCIGIPTKGIMTGIFYAIPLLLTAKKFAQEDIGQIIVFYAISVLISTGYISKITDRVGKTGRILFWGTQMGGMGLLLLSALGPDTTSVLSAILGMVILGLAHGFIHAPIVTHISNTKTAHKLGIHSTVSLYRFLERIGHVLGPIITGLILTATSQSPFSIAILGFLVIGFGIIFQLPILKAALTQTNRGGKK